jgi:hypothetical protein
MIKLQHFTPIIFFLLLSDPLLSQDQYEDIATREYEYRTHLLVVPQPPVLPDISLDLKHDPSAVFKPVKEISTKEELYAELDKMRKQYEPFMQNLAPATVSSRHQIPLTEFNWRKETPLDLTDFPATLRGEGTWEKVTIPHYGLPLGKAVTYYYCEVELDNEAFSKGSLFICFKGVDYKASVFVNGRYCGSHEGFFAPFEFEIFKQANRGKNTILVKVENDYSNTGGQFDDKGNNVFGDKIYAGSGPGYNEPDLGWHDCPAAMGIYQDCYIESRSSLHINDIFVRPLVEKSRAEAWIEVNNFEKYPVNAKLKISVYGQNFSEKVLEEFEYIPAWGKNRLQMGFGSNFMKIPIEIKNFRYWDTETPWLYQIQVKVYDEKDNLTDTRVQQFGMRSFTMDTINIPRGRMFLNGKMIRLRGANTMGFEQQDVMHKDWNQLRDDILLAKLCNMNYLRITQRPVQSEVYDFCDMLGLMNQCDFPLFGNISRTQFAEAVRQVGEMERLVRKHPSVIMDTYMNERSPNGKPHRSLSPDEENNRLFPAMDLAVLIANPDRVIKAGEGDYDPPSPGLPDSHCYNIWYNGHGIELGELYKGYWQKVKPNWLYGCGEFGAEGLDPLNVMQKYYPKSWLPKDKEDEKTWTANRISMAQTQRFHYMFYNTQYSLKDWIEASQNYQASAIKFVTESFRRDSRMVSFAIHLFIDAWPAGWMKTIMDVDRQPKKAYFAYRNALAPVMVSLRSDRNQFYSGEKIAVEAWICNDLNEIPKGYYLKYQLEQGDKIIFANQIVADIPENSSGFQGFIKYKMPDVTKRTSFLLRTSLVNEKGKSISQNEFPLELFPRSEMASSKVFILGSPEGKAFQFASQTKSVLVKTPQEANVILIDDYSKYAAMEASINSLVYEGKIALFLELPEQQLTIANSKVTIEKTAMGDYYFVSPVTGHPMVKDFKPFDFNMWYNSKRGLITPILSYTIAAPEWKSILSSGASNWSSDKGTVMAAGEQKYGKGVFRICELKLTDRMETNPTAHLFADKLMKNK